MQALRTTLVLALVLAAPGLAAATYGPDSSLDADAPASLSGRVDALVTQGVAGFLSDGPDESALLSLTADELAIHYEIDAPDCSDPTACLPDPTMPRAPDGAKLTLRDARVSLDAPTNAGRILVTNDRDAYADTSSFGPVGALFVNVGGATSYAAPAQELRFAPNDEGWSADDPRTTPTTVYTAPARHGSLSATGGALRAAGGFETFVQGFSVHVTGIQEDGAGYDHTFVTRAPERDGSYSFLTFEARAGDLRATSRAPLSAFGVGVVDVPEGGSVALTGVNGTLVKDGDRVAYSNSAVKLEGPVSLSLTKVSPDAKRLTLGVSSALRVLATVPPDAPPASNTAALVTAGALGAGGAGLLIAALYFWPRLKFAATLALLPLYSRIERDDVLDHSKRDEIYELIRASPGIHAHEIGAKANIGWGTTVYHLKLLENHSLVVSKKTGRYKRFFVNTGEFTKKKDLYGALRNETAKAVAQFVVDHPGANQKELCAALGIQPSLASWHVEKLEGVGLVKRVRDGRQVRYFAGPAWSDLNVRVDPAGGASAPAET